MTKITRQTVLQKMGLISRLAWEYARENMDTDGLSSVQQKVCIAIYNDPGLSQDAVAQELGMDKSSIAKLVAKLMAGSYIRRETNPEDRREYKLYLDERGAKCTDELVKNLNFFMDKFISPVDSGIMERMNAVLDTVLENYTAEL